MATFTHNTSGWTGRAIQSTAPARYARSSSSGAPAGSARKINGSGWVRGRWRRSLASSIAAGQLMSMRAATTSSSVRAARAASGSVARTRRQPLEAMPASMAAASAARGAATSTAPAFRGVVTGVIEDAVIVGRDMAKAGRGTDEGPPTNMTGALARTGFRCSPYQSPFHAVRGPRGSEIGRGKHGTDLGSGTGARGATESRQLAAEKRSPRAPNALLRKLPQACGKIQPSCRPLHHLDARPIVSANNVSRRFGRLEASGP